MTFTFALRFLRGKQMAAYVNKSGQLSLRTLVIDYLSDPGLRRIPCYTLFHPVTYPGFPAPGVKLSFSPRHPARSWQHRCEE